MVFAWTSLLGPALHLANHRDDHDHDAGGDRGADRSSPKGPPARRWIWHDHGDQRAHAHPATADTRTLDPTAFTRPARTARLDDGDGSPRPAHPFHGRGAAEHFGLALLDAAPFIPPPPPLAVTTAPPEAPVDQAPPPRSSSPWFSRGPPRSIPV
jgi:hypothetical protein